MGSSLLQKIQEDFTASRKDKALQLQLSVLTLLLSAVKNKQIDTGKEISDDELVALVQKSVKERMDSIDAYKKAGREELAEKEEQEIAILKKYLPEEVSREEINAIVDSIIAAEGKPDPKQFGMVMKKVLDSARATGKLVNGGLVSEVVKSKLA